MSNVTNVILHMGILNTEEDKQALEAVNIFFKDDRYKGFVLVDDPALPRGWYGGSKYLECSLALGAFNYLRLNDLIMHLRSLQWNCPEDVQLIIKDQNESRFKIINVFDDPIDWEPSGDVVDAGGPRLLKSKEEPTH